jgi:phenylacetate-CoA ligase
MRERLESRFGCPVLDLYSLNEAGPVAVADPAARGHVLLQHRLYVEVVDADGHPLAPGERGEVTLTGGFNFCLPLLRYRTGDYAALRFDGTQVVLAGLEGRPPVRFRTMRGEWLNNIEVTHALQRFALSQFTVHQNSDGGLTLRLAGAGADVDSVRKVILELFGPGQRFDLQDVGAFDGKVIQYTSDLAESLP